MKRDENAKKKVGLLKVILIGTLATIVVAVSILVGFFNTLDTPPIHHPSVSVLFKVESGESLGEIAVKLQKEGLIQSELFLKAVSWLEKTGKSFRRGVYEIPAAATTRDIHRILVDGVTAKIRLTIPEGLTISKIATLFEEKKICTAESFLDAVRNKELLDKYSITAPSFEGMLFPDTYFFAYETSAEEVVEVLVKAFFKVIGELAPDLAGDSSVWYNRLILASLVEREYRLEEEAPKIASVFRNRLDNRMRLGSCATIEYIITEIRKKPHPKRIFIEDTEYPSSYNTYLNLGLPPSPISNPGRTALKAAFNPIETDYLYFVVKDPQKGSHVFTKNYSDHNSAKDIYINNYFSKP